MGARKKASASRGGNKIGVIYARFSSHAQREESIEGQLRECKAYAEKNNIMIIGSYIDRAMSAKTDNRPQFQQMLELLMDNAVKYGKENGEISVSLQTQRRLVRMKFSNSCEELPDIDPDRLFDRFYRADTSRSRQTGGSGIGLAVVRAIAEHNGGKASAHFCPDNVIEFVIEIPENKKQKV